MAKTLTFTPTYGNQICNFTHNSISFTRNGAVSLSYDCMVASPTLSLSRISITAASNPGTGVALTAELKIGNNSTGQLSLVRLDDTTFELTDTTVPNSVAVPTSNDDISVQIIIRANGTVKTTNTFTVPPPLYLYVTSISPSPATGKVCTVILNRSIPSDFKWWLADRPIIATYHDDPVYRQSNYIYGPDMATQLFDVSSGFDSFTFYVPYDSSKTRSDNQAKIRIMFDVGSGSTKYTHFNPTLIRYIFEHTFTMSYVNQTDATANPTVVLNAIAENPSGMLSTYGKYIGGAIGKLTFSLSSVICKFGSSFSSRTVYLYNSDGTLNKQWTYSNTNSFTLSLTNTVDRAWYIVIAITDSAGRVGSATTAVFQVYGYNDPSIISLNASRCNQDGTPNDSGSYCKITYQFKVNALGNQNSKKVTLVAPDGSHVYTNLDYDHGSAYQYISAADPEHSYPITVTVEDDFKTSSRSMNISTAGVIMDFLAGGNGIGLGKVAELADTVDINPNWTLRINNIDLVQWMQDIEDRLTAGNL